MFSIFHSNNNPQLYEAAGKQICAMFQNVKDEAEAEKMSSDLAEAGNYTVKGLIRA